MAILENLLGYLRKPFVPEEPTPAPAPRPEEHDYQNKRADTKTVSSAGSFFGYYMPGGGARFVTTPYNPDELVQRKGIKTYRKMLTDEQVKAALSAKQYAVLSTGYEIQLPDLGKDAEQAEIDAVEEQKQFLEFSFEEMTGGIESKLLGIMDAMAFGYSASEKIYSMLDYGPFDGKWMLQDLLTRPPEDIQFEMDSAGQLTKNAVVQHGKGLPKEKFVLYSYHSSYGNPYGDSDLRAAYRGWWCKDNLLKLMAVSLERYAEPIAVATYEGVLTDSQRTDIENFLKNLQSRSGILLPKNVTLDFKTPPPRAAEAFIPAINLYDQHMRIAILMPGLIGLAGEQQVGSLARAVKEFDVFLWILGQLRKDLELIVNEQIIKPLIDLNYEVDTGKYPKFKFNAVTEEARQRSYELFLEGLGAGGLQLGPEDQNKLRELIDFEPLPEDFDQIDPSTGLPPGERPPPPPAPGGFGGDTGGGFGGDQYGGGNGYNGSSSTDEGMSYFSRSDYHLPGEHDQESHGNRATGAEGNEGGGSRSDEYRKRVIEAEKQLDWQSHVNKHVGPVTEALHETLNDIWNKASREKQIGRPFPRSLKGDLENLVRDYLTEAYKPDGDRTLRRDFDYEFNAQVINPFLNKAFDQAFPTRYSGFGPKSITMRLAKMDKIPFHTAMSKASHEWEAMRNKVMEQHNLEQEHHDYFAEEEGLIDFIDSMRSDQHDYIDSVRNFSWREEQHPRDKGKFAPKGGGRPAWQSIRGRAMRWKIRREHPDWTRSQVHAEIARALGGQGPYAGVTEWHRPPEEHDKHFSFPDHKGIPGHRGGSLPRGEGGGESDKEKESQKAISNGDEGTPEKPKKVSTVEEALAAILGGQVVEIKESGVANLLLGRMAQLANEIKQLGKRSPVFDLCSIQVKDSNVFCASQLKSKRFPQGIPRLDMPQFAGTPVSGSKAAKSFPKNPWNPNEVDGAADFINFAKEHGLKTSNDTVSAIDLKPTQRELIGPKVAAMMTNPKADLEGAIFVSSDNYIIDGHHRWAANIGKDMADNKLGDIKMKVRRVDAPVSEVYFLAKRWAKQTGMEAKKGVAASRHQVANVYEYHPELEIKSLHKGR